MDRYLKPIDKVKKKKPLPRPTAAAAAATKKKPLKKSMDFDRDDIIRKKAASLASASTTTKGVRKGPARKVRKPTTQKLLNEVGAHKKTVTATRAKRKAAAAASGLSTPEKPKVSY